MKTVIENDSQQILSYNRGFTLLEVMLCVGIISFIIVSLFSLQSGSIALTNKNKFAQTGPIMIEKVLALIGPDFENPDQTQGDFGTDHPGMTWSFEITAVDFEDIEFFADENKTRLKKIDIRIEDATDSNLFELSVWRLANE